MTWSPTELEAAKLAEWHKTGEPCHHCECPYEKCTVNAIFRMRSPCCGPCLFSGTHNEREKEAPVAQMDPSKALDMLTPNPMCPTPWKVTFCQPDMYQILDAQNQNICTLTGRNSRDTADLIVWLANDFAEKGENG